MNDDGLEPADEPEQPETDSSSKIAFDQRNQNVETQYNAGRDINIFQSGRPQGQPPAPGKPPYKGLEFFTEDDAELFFGRDKDIQELANRLMLTATLGDDLGRIIIVIGASGSGKSSLVRAGLIPALRRQNEWSILPVALPHEVLDQLNNLPKTVQKLLLVVDQFEETFIQYKNDPAQKAAVIEAVTAAARAAKPEVFVVLALRAEFYGHCQNDEHLRPLLETHLMGLTAMSREQLRAVIVEPAQRGGWALAPKLEEVILDDAVGEPGNLPFLSQALRSTWALRDGVTLTLEGYERTGGVDGAIASKAEAVYKTLTADQQRAVRSVLVQLTDLGESQPDTRRRVLRSQVLDRVAQINDAQAALMALAESRLVVSDKDKRSGEETLEVAHEALIRGWPTLLQWLEDDREAELQQRELEDRVADWQKNDRPDDLLIRGIHLKQAEQWWRDNPDRHHKNIEEFIQASQQLAEREVQEKASRRKYRRVVRVFGVILAATVLLGVMIVATRARARVTAGSQLMEVEGGAAMLQSDNPTSGTDHLIPLLKFQIEPFEVSNRQYGACFRFGPCARPSPDELPAFEQSASLDLPVVNITAYEAHVFCTWLGRRLPTSVEWERAARGAVGRPWPWGDIVLPDSVFPPYVVPVNAIPETATIADPPGLYHLADNVSEWVVRVEPDCERATCHQAWDGESDTLAYMGGAYDRYLDSISTVTNSSPSSSDSSIGFRCAADATQ